MSITHAKVSLVGDGPDPTLVRPSDWNAAHSINLTPAEARRNVFVQNAAPSPTETTYLWIQTGLGPGTDMTFWIEDGLP